MRGQARGEISRFFAACPWRRPTHRVDGCARARARQGPVHCAPLSSLIAAGGNAPLLSSLQLASLARLLCARVQIAGHRTERPPLWATGSRAAVRDSRRHEPDGWASARWPSARAPTSPSITRWLGLLWVARGLNGICWESLSLLRRRPR